VKEAKKDYPESNIKKGESYYWWKFRNSGIIRSKTPPTRQQLTQSPFLQQIYDIEDRLSSLTIEDDLEAEVNMIIDELEGLKDECEEKLYAMPEQLQETSPAGQFLQERIDCLESMIDELESIDFDVDEEDIKDEVKEEMEDELEKDFEDFTDEEMKEFSQRVKEKIEERKEEILGEIQSVVYEGN
jgi:hypothetical protein